MKRMKLYKNALVLASRLQEFDISEVDAIFRRNLPNNDLETSQMINNLTGKVDNELLVGQLSFVEDAKETVELAKKEAEEPAASQFGEDQTEKIAQDDEVQLSSTGVVQ